MTVTLNLRPDLETGLSASAAARGMSLEDYVLSIVEKATASSNETPAPDQDSARLQAVRRMIEFGEEHHLDFGEPITREVLHEGHRF